MPEDGFGLDDLVTLVQSVILGSRIQTDVRSVGGSVTLGPGESHVGEIGYSKRSIVVTPTITAGAYAANDIIGGIQTLTDAAREMNGSVTLDTLIIQDLSLQDADITLWFLNQNPAGIYTDNVPLGFVDADLGLVVGVRRILSSDYDDAANNSVATLGNVGLSMTAVGTANLYVIAQIKVGDTYGTTSDLTFLYHFSQH